MFQPTVTISLKEYTDLQKSIEVNHVKNFISKEYSDVQNNEFKIVLNEEKIEKHFGKRFEGEDIITVEVTINNDNEVDVKLLKSVIENSLNRYSQSF